MNWSPAQRQMLEAMGYTPFRRAGTGPAAQAPAPAPAAPAPAPAQPTASPALLEALRRAARGGDLSGLLPADLAALRTDPAAKRALWQRLRARRRH